MQRREKRRRPNNSENNPNGLPTPRFPVGARVACRVKNGDWVPGVILRHWWRAPKWPPGKIGPYQVCLDNDTVIGVPLDNPSIIRLSKVSLPPKASLRFKAGTRVLCRVGKQGWLQGVIIKTGVNIPYTIKLNSGRMIQAPVDNDTCIREHPVQQLNPGNKGPEQKKLRFKIGDTVACKIQSQPPRWTSVTFTYRFGYYSTVTGLNLPHPKQDILAPYEITLHMNKMKVYAPNDSDTVIRAATARRFQLGREVECKLSDGSWSKGKIIAVNAMLPNNANVVPYRIELNNGHMIFAPVDYEGIIRADRTVRFEVGQRVKCKMSYDEGMKDVWKYGKIMKLNVTNGRKTCPYMIQLDDGNQIVAPLDSDAVIQAVGETSLDEEFFLEKNVENDLGEIIDRDQAHHAEDKVQASVQIIDVDCNFPKDVENDLGKIIDEDLERHLKEKVLGNNLLQEPDDNELPQLSSIDYMDDIEELD